SSSGLALRPAPSGSSSLALDVLELDGPALDPAGRGREPVRHLAGLVDGRRHQALHVGLVRGGRQPLVLLALPLLLGDEIARGIEVEPTVEAHGAVEAAARQRELVREAGLLDGAIPLVDAALRVLHILVAQHFVHGVAQGYALALPRAAVAG